MIYAGINFSIQNPPTLDPDFIPAGGFVKSYLSGAKQPFAIALERDSGYLSRFNTFIHGVPERAEADFRYIEYILKFMLYSWGGWKACLCGDEALSKKVANSLANDERHDFVRTIVRRAYGKELSFEIMPYEKCSDEKICSRPIGRHMNGCRIGFDAGGSDRKVSAVIDGEAVFSEEVEWTPKLIAYPEYHFNGIVDAFRAASSKMPRVDAIGVSTAGIVVDNHVMSSTLFQKLPDDVFAEKARDIYIRAAKEVGDIPLEVQNDGDVSALAGSMSLHESRVLGIAMGTSEAAGYVDAHGNLTGWLNELALTVIDLNGNAPFDQTALDRGVGASYFSQDSVIRLASAAGIELDKTLQPAQKLKAVQTLMEAEDSRAKKVYANIGCYLAHTLPLYRLFYNIKHILLLGRVMSGKGGDIILAECKRILAGEYPELSREVNIWLPNENTRRVGQSVAAASLPEL